MKRSYDDMFVLVICWPASNAATLALVLEQLEKNESYFYKLRVEIMPPPSQENSLRLFNAILRVIRVNVLETQSLKTMRTVSNHYFFEKKTQTKCMLNPLTSRGHGRIDMHQLPFINISNVPVISVPKWWNFSNVIYEGLWEKKHTTWNGAPIMGHKCFQKVLGWSLRLGNEMRPAIPVEIVANIFALVNADRLSTYRIERIPRVVFHE